MCCLKYEQEAYEDLIRTSPKMESFVDTPEGRGTVVEVDLLRQRVKVRMEDSPETISVFQNTDIAVLRSGKAKKNDPPIPADLAPISGSGKRVRRQETEEKLLLEPIRFRYSTEQIVEETEQVQEEAAAEGTEQKPSRSRRRRQGNKENKEAAPKQAAEPAQKQEKPKREPKKETKEPKDAKPAAPEAEGEQQPRKPRRRPSHRRHKPKTGGDSQ